MITGQLKNKIDSLWLEFHTGGITNPLTVIEQITFLMYARLLDMNEISDEKKELRTKQPFKHRFNQDQQNIRWQNLKHIESADVLLSTIRDQLFPYFKSTAGGNSLFADFMKDAQLMVQKPSLLVKAVAMVDELPLDQGDTKGDLYEYLLSKLTTAGINGQFRTPRHIIRAMVEILNPTATDRICDPACGTAGFLSVAYEFMLQKYSSEAGTHSETIINEKGELDTQTIYMGDLLAAHRKHVDTDMFHGFDFDTTMLRISAMNMVMHGVAEPDIHYQDTLSQRFAENHPNAANEGFDIILANPPFKGNLDEGDVAPELLRMVKTKKTELLFVALILRMLKIGGRAAVIVPDGVLFGSSNAHQQLREELVERNQLEAIISLPSGVFRPYAGVSTAILIFTKGGVTDRVMFYDLAADGFSLDDKRTPIIDNDLPEAINQWREYHKLVMSNATSEMINKQFGDKTKKTFTVDKADIASQKYDLSINRYKQVVYTEESYAPPKEILRDLRKLEAEILQDLDELEAML